ncbi:MAG: hypothetical protein QF541_25545, partial [Lentisphaeria bacterium]|nr:hypothetical protein [Lentisphaeria bacterium]
FRSELEAEMPEGFQAVNSYGTTEAGGPNVGIACPHSHDRNEMHLINEDTVLTEILDPETLAPVGPGEVGEIVITTLAKWAQPMLRYRTRDITRLVNGPCPCGRTLPSFGLTLGRRIRLDPLPPDEMALADTLLDAMARLPKKLSVDLSMHQLHHFQDGNFELRTVAADSLPPS